MGKLNLQPPCVILAACLSAGIYEEDSLRRKWAAGSPPPAHHLPSRGLAVEALFIRLGFLFQPKSLPVPGMLMVLWAPTCVRP